MSPKKDDLLETFINVCDKVAKESSYISKSQILQNFFENGTSGKGFTGDIHLWINMLLPWASQRVYNLQNKQIIKLFSRIFQASVDDMLVHLEQGDVSETIRTYFSSSNGLKPVAKSSLTLQDVDEILVNLTTSAKEDYQKNVFTKLCKKATADDLKMVIRLIKQDLKINAKERHVLDAFGSEAYPVYQSSRNLKAVVDQFASKSLSASPIKGKAAGKKTAANAVPIQLMTPISPMLANACHSAEEAFKKNSCGFCCEIKYDGERVQIHKQGKEFRFFSRNLKPVMDHKVQRFKEIVPKAFPTADEMIIDSEIVLVNTENGELLPFGTLGVHKKQEHKNAEVCLFVFDCIFLNGQDLRNVTLQERRKILEANLNPIESYVRLSESYFLKTKDQLSLMTAKVLAAGMEGIVLKNANGLYQPGKRGWLKIKKDYLFDGKMADTADLVVLGGWFGSGKKGGMLSIFLMGCLDKKTKNWKTVTKVHSGLDDATMESVHNNLFPKMERSDVTQLPPWFICHRSLVPDYVTKDPNQMPVWEITGAEFTNSNVHTANGVSIRFPRITRIRDDKTPKESTNLQELQNLFDASKKNVNVDLLLKDTNDNEDIKIETSMATSPLKKGIPTDSPKKDSVNQQTKKRTSLKRERSDESTSPKQKSKKKREVGVFSGFTAYFRSTIQDKIKEYTREFDNNGGLVTLNRDEANIVIYENQDLVESIATSRTSYSRNCKHVHLLWIKDSIQTGEVKPFAEYAVCLVN